MKIIGDSHGPVRIGARVQILENTVLHLLPDNELVVEDDVVIGPGATIHGCHLGAGTVVEPAAIVCDFRRVGAGSIIRAGACVKQRARFGARAVLDGFPAGQVGSLDAPPARPCLARAARATVDLRPPAGPARPRRRDRAGREAGRVFAAARHPKSFIALDGADHDVSEPRHARRVAGLVAAWVEPYLPDHAPSPPSLDPTGSVVVTDAGTARYTQTITAGRHLLTADEPESIGGADAGPNPYELLLAALGACKSMTIRMYADRQGFPLHRTTVRLRHDRVHANDCAQCEQDVGMLSRIRSEIDIEGPLNDQDRRRIVEIADRCPVHRTLSSEIAFETTET